METKQAGEHTQGETHQHTKGEWFYKDDDRPDRIVAKYKGDEVYVAYTRYNDGDLFDGLDALETAANSKLIAAAPDMLKALENLVECARITNNGNDIFVDTNI